MYCGKEYFLTTWCDVFTKEEYAKSVKDDMREHWNTLGAEEKKSLFQ